MAARAEHDSRVREAQPVFVVGSEVADDVADELVASAGHHEADGEADRMSFGGHKVESSQRAQSARALEVHVEDYAAVFIEKHVAQSVNSLNGVGVTIPHLLEVGELLLDKLGGFVVCPDVCLPAWVHVDAALDRLLPFGPPVCAVFAEGDVM